MSPRLALSFLPLALTLACGDKSSDDEGDGASTEDSGARTDADAGGDGSDGTTADDRDGDGWTTAEGDCDDSDAAVHPEAIETCNGQDDDCNGDVDDGLDLDADGWSLCDGDCDDDDPGVHPDAIDVCGGVDEDCDGDIDEDADEDADGVTACDGDCDDADARRAPGLAEVPYDGIDQDCDSVDLTDVDGDGADAVQAGGEDCDDGDAGVGALPAAADPTVLSGVLSAGQADVVLIGSAVSDEFGAALTLLDDTNGDGTPELVVGAPEANRNGTVYVFSGAAVLAATTPLSADDAMVRIEGEESSSRAGVDLAAPGDVDDDGLPELIIGAHEADYSSYDYVGYAYLMDGTDLTGDHPTRDTDDSWYYFIGGYNEVNLGYAVAAVGDMDGDGTGDWVLAAPGPSPDASYGGPGGFMFLCDGRGFRSRSGGGFLYEPSRECDELTWADYSLFASSLWGGPNSVWGGHDLSGDGVPDLVYGYHSGSAAEEGIVSVRLGGGSDLLADAENSLLGVAEFSVVGAAEDDALGAAVSTGCDLDADGASDLLAGAPGRALGATALRPGALYAFSGSTVALGGEELDADAEALVTATASEDGAQAGFAVACAGDIDGDGLDDVVVGAPAATGGAGLSGVTYLASGADLAAGGEQYLACGAAALTGEGADHAFGTVVVSLGDLNADGFADVAVGAPGGGPNGEGAVYVFLGP